MRCEICKEREATVHLTQVVEGSVKKVHLCAACAEQKGIDLQGPISITDFLMKAGAAAIEPPSVDPERSCPRCHARRTDFKKSGRLGCDACYDAFADELPGLLRSMHHSDRHAGKVPRGLRERIRIGEELTALQKDMDAAVGRENFEEAARLRDRIQVCRARLAAAEQAPGRP
jgi:protein arginine kinase activator